jgi:hypothetical protein
LVLVLLLLLLLLKTKSLVLCLNHLRWKRSGSINHLSGLILRP